MPGLIAHDRKYIGGTVWTKSMGLNGVDPDEVSPYHRADEITKPLLIIHAEDDHRVRYRQAEKMAKKMKKQKKDVTLVTLKDGDHHMDTEAARIDMLAAMEKFLEKHLKGAK
ncbi:alpha/beta hydrolase family protein [Paremcibacter congregatus]|nr:prolyl oligopeptidase family serine peptidase [Paremcibacter congregatus]